MQGVWEAGPGHSGTLRKRPPEMGQKESPEHERGTQPQERSGKAHFREQTQQTQTVLSILSENTVLTV